MTLGCSEVVDFSGYSFEAQTACDGTPAFTDPQGDGSLILTGSESLGIPAAELYRHRMSARGMLER